MKKHKIFLDFDETITKSISAFCLTYTERHKEEIKNLSHYPYPIWENVSTWNMRCEMPNLDLNELNEIFDSPRLFDHLAFYADSDGTTMADFIAELLDEPDVDLFIASKGNYANLHQKRLFLQQKLPFFPIDSFIPMEGTVMDKSELEGTALFDDHQENLFTSRVKYKILVNFSGEVKEWNNKAMADDSIYKCYSVNDIIKITNEILCFERGCVGE